MDEVDRILEVRAEEPDLESPNSARMYDYMLDGSANFAVDRAAADELQRAMPEARHYVRCNRAFLGRAVRHLAADGIDQFLDLGSGVPTVGNVHEIAQRTNPNARVAYVDHELVAVTHARQLLTAEGAEAVTINQVDIRQPEDVLAAPGVAGLLDFTRPVAVLAVGILPFITDDEEAAALVASYREATVSGSALAVSHISPLSWTDEQIHSGRTTMQQTPTPEVDRTPDAIRKLLGGYTLIPPGLVPVPQWRPDTPPSETDVSRSNCYGAVGDKL